MIRVLSVYQPSSYPVGAARGRGVIQLTERECVRPSETSQRRPQLRGSTNSFTPYQRRSFEGVVKQKGQPTFHFASDTWIWRLVCRSPNNSVDSHARGIRCDSSDLIEYDGNSEVNQCVRMVGVNLEGKHAPVWQLSRGAVKSKRRLWGRPTLSFPCHSPAKTNQINNS